LVVAVKDVEDESNVESAQDEGNSKKDADRRISPASTLESSFEALNVKKFDGKFKAYSHYASVENYCAMGLKCHAYY